MCNEALPLQLYQPLGGIDFIPKEVKSLTKEERKAAAEQFLRDVGVNLPLDEVMGIVEKDNSTSALINDLIQLIAQEILKDFSEDAEQPELPKEG